MKINTGFTGLMCAALTLTGASMAFGQAGGTAMDRLDAWRRAQEEFKSAERAMRQQGLTGTTGSVQRELDKLNELRASAEREIEYTKSKLNNAARQLTVVQKTGPQSEIEKWQREVNAWQSRVNAAQLELDKVEEQTQDALTRYQDEMFDSGDGLILPGESIQLFVLEDETFNGLYQVRQGGYVIMPRIGRVQLAGKDIPSAEKAIKDALETTQLRQATVMLERTKGVFDPGSGDIIYLAGEFRTPGPMRLPQGFSPTVVTTILRSGGISEVGDLTRVKVLRLESGNALVEDINVEAILEGTGLQSDLALNAGDILVVPAYNPIVYITGNVNQPGVLALYADEQLTAYTAILRAGGFARFAAKKRVYVIRNLGNGEKKKIPINIKDVMKGDVPDIVLQGLDIIVVPEKFFSF